MEAQFTCRKTLHYPKLMIPGPVDVPDSVIAAMANPVLPHYGAQWTALYHETTHALKSVFQTAGEVFLLVGSGTSGLEAAINSLFAPGEKVLVVNNGFFGDRLIQLAKAHNLTVVEAVAEWGKPVEPAEVEKLLKQEHPLAGMIAVHHETSTGVLNPIRELGQLAQSYAIPFMVDAVSSLGGEALSMDAWGIDLCVAGSNKCLESAPGITPVAASQNGWKYMEGKHNPAPGWYLNLQLWKRYLEEWGSWHPAPVTMATPAVLALNAALEELFKEGLQNRINRYQHTATHFRQAMEELGFHMFVEPAEASSCISAVSRPPSLDVPTLIAFLLEEKNIQIAGGLGRVKGEIFRIGHMGKAGCKEYMDELLEALREYLQ